MKSLKLSLLFAAVILLFFSFNKHKPVLYIIGDSTVKYGDGQVNNLLHGWVSFMNVFFDPASISVQNHAVGGSSSMTFITEGRWDSIMAGLQKGDFVMLQFGHNDMGPLYDTVKAGGTLKGIGDGITEIYDPIRKVKAEVHTYGWYLHKST